MQNHSTKRSLAAISLLFAAALPAQVQPGQAAYAALNFPPLTAEGGIVLFDPLQGISPCSTPGYVRVQDVPANLVSAGTVGGANAILVRESDGSLVVGEVGQNREVGIYHLTLQGTKVVQSRFFSTGFTAGLGQIHEMSFLGEDKVAFGHSFTALATDGIAVLDLGTGAITPIPITGLPAGLFLNSFTVDKTGTTAYLGFYGATPGIYSVPVGGGALTKVGPTLPSGPYQMECDADNVLHVASFTKGILRLQAGAWVAIDTSVQTNGMTFDPVNGDIVFASVPFVSPTHMFRGAGAAATELGAVPPKDAVTGIDIRSSMVRSGAPSGGVAPYRFAVAPNPGGLPVAGNSRFSLTVHGSATAVVSLMQISSGLRSSVLQLGGATLLLQHPTRPMRMYAVPGGYRTDLPLPSSPSLCGTVFHAQSLHVDASGLASSEAVSVTIQ